MQTYEDWTHHIQHEHDPHYYRNIHKYKQNILNDHMNYKAHALQRKLNLNAQQLATIINMLKGYEDGNI